MNEIMNVLMHERSNTEHALTRPVYLLGVHHFNDAVENVLALVFVISDEPASGVERLHGGGSAIDSAEVLVGDKDKTNEDVGLHDVCDADLAEAVDVVFGEHVLQGDEHTLVEFHELAQQVE